jgi:hypothetical protein
MLLVNNTARHLRILAIYRSEEQTRAANLREKSMPVLVIGPVKWEKEIVKLLL